MAVLVIVARIKIDGLRKSRDLVLNVGELLLCQSGEAVSGSMRVTDKALTASRILANTKCITEWLLLTT